MCDGRLFPPRLFAAWRVEAPFSTVSLFDGFCTLCYLLTRGVILHDSACCSKEDSFDDYGRPRDALSCLLFSALWLRCNKSILVQETQSVKDTDMTCSKMPPIKAATCLQVGPMPVDPFASSDFFRIFAAS